MARSRTALSFIAISSTVSAAITWAVLLVGARVLGPDRYSDFLVVWGVFFGTAGVLAGLQQEVTRSASHAQRQAGDHRLAPGVGLIAGAGAVLVLATSPVWAEDVFGRYWLGGAVVLAGCFVGYTAANLVNGVLASRQAWSEYAVLILAEGILRAAVTVTVLWAGSGPVGWGIAITAGLSAWVVVGVASRKVRTTLRATGDARVRAFVRQSGQAMVASACSAVMITGFPPLVRLVGPAESGAATGAVFATIIATRAPVLILLNAFQGPIIRHLARGDRAALQWAGRWLVGGVVATGAAAGAAYAVGPAAVGLVFGGDFEPSRSFAAMAAVGVGLLAALTVIGWLILALGRHAAFLAGWVAALATTVVCLSVGAGLEARAGLAMVAGPLTGLAIYAVVTAAARRTVRVGGSVQAE